MKKLQDKYVICTVPAVRLLYPDRSRSVASSTKLVVCNTTLSLIISKHSRRTRRYSDGANLMIFNDELIIKLKMKTTAPIFLLTLFVSANAHLEYDETDPFKEYRND